MLFLRRLLVLLTRRVRQFAMVLGIAVWIPWRVFLSPNNTSLLQRTVDTMETLKAKLFECSSSSSNSRGFLIFLEWLVTPTLLHQVLAILWSALEDLVVIAAFLSLCRILYCLWHFTWAEWKETLVRSIYTFAVNRIPAVQRALDQEADAFAHETLSKRDPNRTITTVLPEKGRSQMKILQELSMHAATENKRWMSGKISGTVYYAKKDEGSTFTFTTNNPNSEQPLDQPDFMSAVYSIYVTSNPLHADYWPKVNQCEAEVIAMCANLMNASENVGCMTSGGTESILLAIRAHLKHYGKRRHIAFPEIICGSTAHAAVWKACDMYNIRPVVIDCSSAPYQLTAAAVARAITCNTIMIYASAPCYPQGVVDEIPKLSKLALSYNIGLHVDACLGGFVLAFDETAPVYDFRNEGVTSMSLDTHKYGYAAKGTSVVLYSNTKLRHAQYFSYAAWSGGLYATPTFAGSRSGALSVCAWAAMLSLGKEGYRQRVQSIKATVRTICEGIPKIPGLKLMTPPGHQSMVVCFGSDELDIYSIKDAVRKNGGWDLNDLQNPAAVHFTVTLPVTGHAKEFLRDLQAAVETVRKETGNGIAKQGTAGIYGAVGNVPSGSIEYLLNVFVDMTMTP